MNFKKSTSAHETDNPENNNPKTNNETVQELEKESTSSSSSSQEPEKQENNPLVKEPNQENKESNKCENCKKILKNFAYLHADFENYRKNIIKERGLLVERIEAKTIRSFLTLIDDFERALKEIEVSKKESDNKESRHVKGFKMMYQSFLNLLASHGVEEIENKIFDPSNHEAILQVESDEKESGQIVDVVEKGYRLGKTVLRPSKVTVAK